jgi:hypothetical protein
MSEYHDAVKLLLARMESHPEEFTNINMTREQDRLYTSRWGALITQFWHVLTSEEQAALNNALIMANRNNFHSEVMKELLEPKIDRIGRQMELFPAQTAYPPGSKPAKLMVNPDITQQALEILEAELERDKQRQRGR